jgi:UPF0716 protein FxsA
MTGTRRRVFPRWVLLVAFIVVPLVEIYVIIQIGRVIGAWWTILLLVVDSVLGSWLVKREGARAWRSLRIALEQHRMPARELADGILILVGGTLMLTPGFVTDAVGIVCILPLTRPLGRRLLAGVISRHLLGLGFAEAGTAEQPGSGPWTRQRPGPADPDNGVVQGEVVDERTQQPPH